MSDPQTLAEVKAAPTVEHALAELTKARSRYDEAHSAHEETRREETRALNALNAAQKAFDVAVAAVRKNPPWNSDWHQRRNHVGVES